MNDKQEGKLGSKCEGCINDNPKANHDYCMHCFQSAEQELANLKASLEEKKEEIRKKKEELSFSANPADWKESWGLQKALEIIEKGVK
jgi:hypothetical protein